MWWNVMQNISVGTVTTNTVSVFMLVSFSFFPTLINCSAMLWFTYKNCISTLLLNLISWHAMSKLISNDSGQHCAHFRFWFHQTSPTLTSLRLRVHHEKANIQHSVPSFFVQIQTGSILCNRMNTDRHIRHRKNYKYHTERKRNKQNSCHNTYIFMILSTILHYNFCCYCSLHFVVVLGCS